MENPIAKKAHPEAHEYFLQSKMCFICGNFLLVPSGYKKERFILTWKGWGYYWEVFPVSIALTNSFKQSHFPQTLHA